jgi:signal transduction histidine kinase
MSSSLRAPLRELAILAAVAVAPLLPGAAGAPLALAGAAAWWWTGQRAARERRLAGALFALAAALVTAAAIGDPLGHAVGGASAEATFRRAHRTRLESLAADARAAAAEIGAAGVRPERRRAAFAALERRSAAAGPAARRRTLLLIDPDHQPTVWSGGGLFHDLGESLPASGWAIRQSVASASVLAVAPIEGARGWRVVAGESARRAGTPPGGRPGSAVVSGSGGWYLAPPEGGRPPELRWTATPRTTPARWPTGLRRAAAAAVALGLFALAALRGAGRVLLAGTVVRRRHGAPAVVALGVGALALGARAAGAGSLPSLALGAATATAAAAWWLARRPRRGAAWGLAGAAAPLALAAIAWLSTRAAGLAGIDGPEGLRGLEALGRLTAGLAGDPSAVVWRMGLVLVAFAFVAVGGVAGAGGRPARWTGAALALVVAGCAFADRPGLALSLLAASGFAAGRTLRPGRLERVTPLAVAVLYAAVLAGGAWVAGERAASTREAERAAESLLPPDAARLERDRRAIEAAFAALDPSSVLVPGAPLSESGDLAYALWRRSPLARYDALSALVVESDGAERSSFSFGLPLDGAGRLDPSPARWVELTDRTWPQRRVEGESELISPDGVRRALHWWLVPRLGFARDPAPVTDLVAGLLRSGSALERPHGLSADARWAVWGADGQRRGSSWEASTPDRRSLPAGPAGGRRVATPEGPSRVAVRRSADGTAAVFLPRLAVGVALERAGTLAAGGALPLLVLGLAALAAALPRSAVRDLVRRALRSYSKRLLIVVAALLLIPVALLYVLLSKTLERRIEREQELAASTALVSVQRVLGEYVLTLEPGFGVGTALDDALLEWLSRVARHEVNLYWGSEIYASSKRDLFAAGLLPRRLPGEVWERLTLAGDLRSRRTARAGAAEYVEIYAPLEVPGQPAEESESRLVVSMPLLAQQEEAVAEAARLRRQALLATLALFLVLVATGTRFARRFTRPIEEIVQGTKRIAGGATELGIRPEEAELEALAEAIDRMAARLAEGRERLVAEKRLVERIVESVTAGVVAVDAADRVLIANRAARELLGVVPGDALPERLAARPQLAPVAELVAGTVRTAARTAVRFGAGAPESPAPPPEAEREWTVVRVPLAEAGDASALVVVEDVTEVMRAQRLDAWAAMARIIAHEIKNPLTPIRLSAEHLRDAWARDRAHFEEVFERCATNILRQVDELREIASEFSLYSQIPRLERQEGDLVAAVREVVDGYRSAPPPGVQVDFSADPDRLPLRFDPKLVPRAVRNLIENSVRASAGGGRVEVSVERRDGAARVRVADEGPGVPAELLPRVLEPYFSTHASGTGLGLPIAAKVAEEHGGSLVARNRPTGGFEVVVTIPLA